MEGILRSDDVVKELLGVKYREEDVYIASSKLPSGKYLIGRMLALCRMPEKGIAQISKNGRANWWRMKRETIG